MVLLVCCWLRSVESFTGFAMPLRATQSQVYPTSLSTGIRQRRSAAVTTTAVMLAKPARAALAKETKVDPALVEAALVEEDKNV